MLLTCKKARENPGTRIDWDGIKYITGVNIIKRNKVKDTSNCFITLKDHHTNFANHPRNWFNPTSNPNSTSKETLDRVNFTSYNNLKQNEWENVSSRIIPANIYLFKVNNRNTRTSNRSRKGIW